MRLHHLCGALFSKQSLMWALRPTPQPTKTGVVPLLITSAEPYFQGNDGGQAYPQRGRRNLQGMRGSRLRGNDGGCSGRVGLFSQEAGIPPRGPAAPRGLPATLDSSLRWNDGGTSDLTPAPYSAPDLEALSSQGRRANPHPLPLGTNGYKGQGRTGLGFTL